MTPNQIADKAREMCAGNEELSANLKAAWNRVCDQIESRAKRIGSRVFEVRQCLDAARLELLTATVDGKPLDVAEKLSLKRVGIE
jgi:hypothetical protein